MSEDKDRKDPKQVVREALAGSGYRIEVLGVAEVGDAGIAEVIGVRVDKRDEWHKNWDAAGEAEWGDSWSMAERDSIDSARWLLKRMRDRESRDDHAQSEYRRGVVEVVCRWLGTYALYQEDPEKVTKHVLGN